MNNSYVAMCSCLCKGRGLRQQHVFNNRSLIYHLLCDANDPVDRRYATRILLSFYALLPLPPQPLLF